MADVIQWVQLAVAALISSAMGGVIGGLVAWGGIRIRLDHLEQKTTSLGNSVVYKDVCSQCQKNSDDRLNGMEGDIKEIKDDVKNLLMVNGSKGGG